MVVFFYNYRDGQGLDPLCLCINKFSDNPLMTLQNDKGVYLGFGFGSNPGISKTVRGTNQKLGKQVRSECAIYTKEGRLVLCICAHIEAPHGGNMGPALLEQ